jgi:gliding motility-associated-like protein
LDGEFWGSGAIQDGLGEGLYAVEALDALGCTGGIDAIPLVAEGDVTLSVPADTVLCAGNALQLEASATGATEAFWSVPDGQDGLGLTAFSASVAEGGTYWTFTAVRLGCVQSDSVQVTGLALPTPNAGQDVLIVSGVVAAIGTAGSTEDWTYAWSPAGDVAFPELAATSTEALFETTTFVLEATTSEGCSAYDTVVVDVLQTLDIPSGFSPNGDGTNDFWNLNGLEQYPSAEITVFNRWGDVLFTQGATDGPWDGNLNGIAVPIGTYYYHIRVDEPALQTEWTGPITILR